MVQMAWQVQSTCSFVMIYFVSCLSIQASFLWNSIIKKMCSISWYMYLQHKSYPGTSHFTRYKKFLANRNWYGF